VKLLCDESHGYPNRGFGFFGFFGFWLKIFAAKKVILLPKLTNLLPKFANNLRKIASKIKEINISRL
jgi:hypothetical protein